MPTATRVRFPCPAQGGSGQASNDVENRLYSIGYQLSPSINYSKDPSNQRRWRGNVSGIPPSITHGSADEVTFWSMSGLKLASYQFSVSLSI